MSNLSDVWHAAQGSKVQRASDQAEAFDTRWQQIAQGPDFDPSDWENICECLGELNADARAKVSGFVQSGAYADLGHFICQQSLEYQEQRAKSAALAKHKEV